MKKYGARLAALLLAASMALPLAACGGKDNGTSQLSGMVYVPQFVECNLEGIDYINMGCMDDTYAYFTADVQEEEKEAFWVDPDTNEKETYTYYEYRTGLFRVSLESGDTQELENYKMLEPSGGSDGESYIVDLRTGENNTIWVSESIVEYTFDLPEGYDEETDGDSKWQYQTGYTESVIRRHLDITGTELERMDVSGLEEKLGADAGAVWSTSFDSAGNVYAFLESGKIVVLDKDLSPLFELDTQDMWGSLLEMADGTMAMLASYSNEEKGSYGKKLILIDQANQSWGAEYEMSGSVNNIVPGGGDYLFYCQNGDSIYGWKSGAAEGEKLFSWLSAGVNLADVNFFSVLSDGRVAAVTQEWVEDGIRIGMTLLTPTDAKTLPEKTTLTLATMWLGYDLRSKIMEFNQNSSTCRIEVVDYSEYDTGADAGAGLTKLNTEILAGNVPDLLYTDSMPLDRYAARGILEDLWPYIEADAGIGGRQGLMEHVLDVASIDGKLYQAFSGFSIRTVAGPAAVTGDRMSWTLAELQQALAAMPEGCTVFGIDDTKEWMFSQVLSMNMDSFVDWQTGTCSFDSDGFKAQLEFCNSFPDEFEWTEDMQYEGDIFRMRSGKQMLARVYMYNFTYPHLYDAAFEGGGAFIGYPREDGGVGSCFYLDDGISMSSTCKDKDAAWSFIRQLFLPQASDDNYDEYREMYYFSGFPVNKSDFEKLRESSMTEVFAKDENGQPQLDGDGQPVRLVKDSWYAGEGQDDILIYVVSQEAVDQVMALYNAIETIYGYDESIYSIIEEQIGAYFAGDKDLDATAREIQNRVQLYMGENS